MSFESRNPTTGELIARYPEHDCRRSREPASRARGPAGSAGLPPRSPATRELLEPARRCARSDASMSTPG